MEFKLTIGFNPESLQRIDAFLKAINAEQQWNDVPVKYAKTVSTSPVKEMTLGSGNATTVVSENGKTPVITLEDLRKLTKDKSDKGKETKAKVKELIAEYAGSVSDIPEDKYTEYHNKLIQL